MFFDGWYDLVRIPVVGICAYVGLVLLLRVTGKRTLSKMNAFDLIVTVALGSTLATVLLSSDVSLAEGLLAFVVLCGLQYAVAFVSVRSRTFENFVKSEPALLFYRGTFLSQALARERVTQMEILAAVRGKGLPAIDSVDAVVLETDGTFSVIAGAQGNLDTLRDVRGDPVAGASAEGARAAQPDRGT